MASTAAYQAQMAKATASTKAFGQRALSTAKSHSEAFTAMGIGAIAFGGALAFGLKSAADAAIDFESSFAGVRKTVDATDEELDAMAQSLRELATEIPVNVNELNAIAESAGQLGIEKGSIVDFTKTIAELGVTTDLAAEQGATSIARFANIMQTRQGDFDRIGSTIVALGNVGASTESEIADMALRIAGAGQVVGLSEAQVLGFANALSTVGVEAESGGSAISRAFVTIADAVASGSDTLGGFAQVAGVSVERFSRLFQTDAAGATVAFIEGLHRVQETGGNVFATLDQLGLSEVRVRDALLRAAGAGHIFRDSLDLASQAFRDNNALQDEAAKRFDTTASKVEIAKNKINDAAISFGELLLPAIAAVMGAIGDFAGFVSDLPGPIRAVVVVLAAAAAAVGLLGGAALIMLPKVALAKAALAEMGIQAGVLRGSLQAVAGALLNPWTVALTVATIGLGIWIAKQQEAKRWTEELTQAIIADSGALGENTRAKIANRLETEGWLEIAQAAGVSGKVLTDALLGNVDAAAQLNATFDAAIISQQTDGWNLQNAAALQLREGYGSLTAEVTKDQEAAQRYLEAVGKTGKAQDDAAASTKRLKGALDPVEGTLSDTASAADDLTSAIEDLAGVQLAAADKAIAWRDSLRDLKSSIKENGPTLKGFGAAADANRSAILRAANAALDYGSAIADKTGSVKAGAKAVLDHVKALEDEAVASGLSREAVEDYIAQLNLTPEDIKTVIRAELAQARQDVHDYKNDLDHIPSRIVTELVIQTHKEVLGGGGRPDLGYPHRGGVLGSSLPRRMHAGGMFGLRADEELVVGQRGERMLSRAQSAAWLSMRSAGTFRPAHELRAPAAPALTVNVYGDSYGIENLTGKIRSAIRGDMQHVARQAIDAEGVFRERLTRMERR